MTNAFPNDFAGSWPILSRSLCESSTILSRAARVTMGGRSSGEGRLRTAAAVFLQTKAPLVRSIAARLARMPDARRNAPRTPP
jgi:hypothetical protein